MTERQRTTSPVNAVRLVFAGAIVVGGALALAGQAGADPDVLIPTPAPGPPAADSPDAVPAAAAVPPPPPAAPYVPEMQNPSYGSGSGPLGFLRDAWHQAKDPYGSPGDSDELLTAGGGVAPPPGAGPAPALPPGFVSLNAPGSETVLPQTGPPQGGPALPPGYYPLNGPPPPGYNAPAPVDPAAPPTVVPQP